MFTRNEINQQTDQYRDRAAERPRGRGGDEVEDRGATREEEAASPDHRTGTVLGCCQQEQYRLTEDHQEAIAHFDRKWNMYNIFVDDIDRTFEIFLLKYDQVR